MVPGVGFCTGESEAVVLCQQLRVLFLKPLLDDLLRKLRDAPFLFFTYFQQDLFGMCIGPKRYGFCLFHAAHLLYTWYTF